MFESAELLEEGGDADERASLVVLREISLRFIARSRALFGVIFAREIYGARRRNGPSEETPRNMQIQSHRRDRC